MSLVGPNSLPRRLLVSLAVAWLAVGALVSAWLIQGAADRAREAFETDARIAHRLMSQRAVQHEAILAMLQLVQPDSAHELARRLAAVYPQVLDIRRGDPEVDGALGEAPSVPRLRVDWSAGRFWMATPPAETGTAYALEISLPLMVPWSEWPFGASPERGTAEVALVIGPDRWVVQKRPAEEALWRFEFRKHLAAPSQPFDLVAVRAFLWRDLPWMPLLLAWAIWAALAFMALLLRRQREARQHAEALLRLGQVSRLNALGELAAGLAHELNQPLTAVLAGAQASRRLLADAPPDVEAARDAMQQVVGQARRAADVVARLRRTIDRPGAHEREAVELRSVVREVMQLMATECKRRGVAVHLPAEEGWAFADTVAVEQIVHNLASNALHALEDTPTPQLTWTLQAGGGRVRLSLRDNGPGLPPEVAARIFEPFVTARPGGLGLGLSLCETLAQEMNGRLWHEKPADGSGAIFVLELPAASPAPEGRS
ncbi:sensor histidine kinase [Thauera sp. 2A1]|uniref:sensor histidine kinase n=1 Tax=Thauera sp. 2A1 TaxID=2570191 RepID=UPI001884B1FA|nr:ATP-binding protein [Thauera sp. 2A1]KAI5913290.1 ATP-binding protein [Thauera sp. 2A1]